MTDVTMIEAIQMALSRALTEDADVIVFGEDVGTDGGVFRATDGLYQRFGSARVRDTPLSETVIAGMAVGAAAYGLRPVAEIQFMGFLYPAIDQLANHAARLRNRTRGRLTCPMVLRAPYGGGVKAPEHHSESMEAMLAHVPGLRVVVPSSPARAYGLLLESIGNPDPVVFLEPKRLYRSAKEHLQDDGMTLPIDKAQVLRQGVDLSIVTWGAMVSDALNAAEVLEESGVSSELIDLSSLKPIDRPTVRASVQKTGRCLIVHEAPLTAGLGAEIAADLSEHCLTSLIAPVIRVTGYDTIMPYPRLEDSYVPDASRIAMAAQRMMEYA